MTAVFAPRSFTENTEVRLLEQTWIFAPEVCRSSITFLLVPWTLGRVLWRVSWLLTRDPIAFQGGYQFMSVSSLDKQGLTCWVSLLVNTHIREKEKCFGSKKKKIVAEDKEQMWKICNCTVLCKQINKKLNYLYQHVWKGCLNTEFKLVLKKNQI